MTSDRGGRRLAVLAHFDPHGQVAPHVRRTVQAIAQECTELVIVSTADLTSDARAWLGRYGPVISRANTGHDFASYRAGLDAVDGEFDQIVLLNDSAVLPLTPMTQIFATMAERGADFWGLTPGFGFAPHVQSYFMVFQRSAISSPAWRRLWSETDDAAERSEIIVHREVGLTTLLTNAGLRADTYFRPTTVDRVRGAARAHSSELRRSVAERRWRAAAGWLRRLPRRVNRPEWNPSVALADIALRHPHVLPVVKLSTLRDDAYALGTPALLAALETRHPEAFDGVRDYLDRTDAAYGARWATTFGTTRAARGYRVR